MSKKVLIITQNFYPVIGSAGNRMKNIFQLLNEHNIETTVLTTEPAYPNKVLYKNEKFWDDATLNGETKKIIRIPINKKKYSNRIVGRLLFYLEIMIRFAMSLWSLRKNKFDIIYVSTPPIFIVGSAFFGKIVNKSKLILEVRDLWPDSLIGVNTFNNKAIVNIFRILEKSMYKQADFIVINSMGFKNHIKRHLKGKNTPLIYLPNGPRQNEIVKAKRSDGEFTVVYTGNLGLAQDIDRLKLISKLLHQKKIHFEVIGYGFWTEEFKIFLNENKLSSVHVRQPTTRKESLELIENSDVAIAFLNDKDVFSTVLPGKVIDYMTCKTPIIAGVKGIAAETIIENNIGFVFERDDMQGMIRQIEELKKDANLMKQLEENCLSTVKTKFLWDNNIENLLEILT